MTDETPPEIIDLHHIHSGFSRYMIATVRLSGGAVVTREIEDHGSAVAVLPYDPVRRSALLVRQFRAPPLYMGLDPELTEAPAGIIDDGEASDAAARREAFEETGVVLGELEPVATVWSSAGVSTERIGLYLAACAIGDRSAGGGRADEDEHITVLEVPLAILKAQADRGEIDDMKLLALVQTLRLKRPELFG